MLNIYIKQYGWNGSNIQFKKLEKKNKQKQKEEPKKKLTLDT